MGARAPRPSAVGRTGGGPRARPYSAGDGGLLRLGGRLVACGPRPGATHGAAAPLGSRTEAPARRGDPRGRAHRARRDPSSSLRTDDQPKLDDPTGPGGAVAAVAPERGPGAREPAGRGGPSDGPGAPPGRSQCGMGSGRARRGGGAALGPRAARGGRRRAGRGFDPQGRYTTAGGAREAARGSCGRGRRTVEVEDGGRPAASSPRLRPDGSAMDLGILDRRGAAATPATP